MGKRLEVEEEKVQRPDVEEQVKRSEMEKDKEVGQSEMEEEGVPRRSDTEKGNGKEEVQTRAEGQETGDAKVHSNHHGNGRSLHISECIFFLSAAVELE